MGLPHRPLVNYWLLQLCNDVRTLEACTVDYLSCAPRSCYYYCFFLTDEIKVGEMSALPKENKKPNIHLKYKLAWATTTRERGAANGAGRPLATSMELAGPYEGMSKRWVPYSSNPALDINHMLHSFMYDWWRGKLQTRISEKEEGGSCISEVCRRWKRSPRERESLKSKWKKKTEGEAYKEGDAGFYTASHLDTRQADKLWKPKSNKRQTVSSSLWNCVPVDCVY